mgnify:FL=1
MLKRQSGAALVVALMITIIMGILAVGISKVATTGQRRENANFGNAISNANAVAGIEAASGFISAIVGVPGEGRHYDIGLFRPATDKSTKFKVGVSEKNTDTQMESYPFKISDIKNIYNGVEAQLNEKSLSYQKGDQDSHLWFRDSAEWRQNDDNSNSIVNVNGNNTVKYRIEERDNVFLSLNPGMNNQANSLGYRFYRVTSRGEDPNSGAVTILQTHISILGEHGE